jgi:hypothetical protein
MKLPSTKRLPAILTRTVYIISSYLITTTSRLGLLREIISDYSEEDTKRILYCVVVATGGKLLFQHVTSVT